MDSTGTGTLRVLEWQQLCDGLAGFAYTPWGANVLRGLQPDPDLEHYRVQLQVVAECLDLSRVGRPLPLSRVEAVEDLLDRAAVEGASLEGEELLRVAGLFELTRALAAYLRQLDEPVPGLRERLESLVCADDFCIAVRKALEPDGSLKESASPELRTLRRRIARLQAAVLARLQQVAARIGDDSVVTIRDGRYVVSVPENARAKAPGVVHDRSQSGATYFVEPMDVLELGNDLRSAEAEERYECLRILRDLTAHLRGLVSAARTDIEVITDIDVTWAKTRWAVRHGAEVPRLSEQPEIALVDARHPMLIAQSIDRGADLKTAREQIVPFSISLTDRPRGLVISGPNTGGKTVCLKAVGLAVLMVQAGIPPAAAGRSVVGRFDRVFADIGDEQSLALSLSTFSAHLKRVGQACRQATPASLVLLDELGVGTDPEEGAALARAVILTLVERGTSVVVTTHYNALKMLREENPAIENAAFVFDETDLAPTYELIVGRPGASFALEIARRLDLPEALIQMAERGVREEARKLSHLLARLAEEEARMAEQRTRLMDKETRLDALLAYNRQAEEHWQRLSQSAERDARREAQQIVDSTRRETEQLVARIRRSQADGQAVKGAHRALKQLARRVEDDTEPVTARPELRVGMSVRVRDLDQHGEIKLVSEDGTRVTVLIGHVHYTVPSTAVQVSEAPARKILPSPGVADAPLGDDFEIDLRGRTVEEAQLELQDLLEQVQRQGVQSVRVIHGRGTGALRRALTTWFRQHPAVASSRLGGRGEGADGVTVLTIKPL